MGSFSTSRARGLVYCTLWVNCLTAMAVGHPLLSAASILLLWSTFRPHHHDNAIPSFQQQGSCCCGAGDGVVMVLRSEDASPTGWWEALQVR